MTLAADPFDPARLPGHVPGGVVVLESRPGWRALSLGPLWRYRDLLWFLARRDVVVRYKQTALGVAWALLQPLLSMVVLSVCFGRFLGVAEKTAVPYPVFLYAGLLPWTFFATAVVAASNSFVANAAMLRKVYFPRLIVPLASLGAPLVDLGFSCLVLVAMMAWYRITPTAQTLLLPLLAGTTLLAAVGVGTLLAGLTALYRDFRFVVTFLVQVWFFATPVIYPATVVPERYRFLFNLNPMNGAIEAFRAALLGTPIDWSAWASSTLVALVCLLAGLVYFARVEHRLADVV